MLRTGLGFPPADKGVVPIVERNDMQASTVQAVDSLGQYSEVGPSFLPEPVFRAQQFGNEKEGQFDDATEESSAQFDDADEFSSGGPQVNRNSFPARPQIVCSSGLPADHTRKRGANTLKPVVAPDDSFGASDASTDTEEGRFDSKQETRAIGEASASREEIGCNDVLCGPEGSKYLHPGNVFFRRLVRIKQEPFRVAEGRDRIDIAKFVRDVVKGLTPPGRFMIRDSTRSNGPWGEIDGMKALESVSHALSNGTSVGVLRCKPTAYSYSGGDQEVEVQTHDAVQRDPPRRKKLKANQIIAAPKLEQLLQASAAVGETMEMGHPFLEQLRLAAAMQPVGHFPPGMPGFMRVGAPYPLGGLAPQGLAPAYLAHVGAPAIPLPHPAGHLHNMATPAPQPPQMNRHNSPATPLEQLSSSSAKILREPASQQQIQANDSQRMSKGLFMTNGNALNGLRPLFHNIVAPETPLR